MTQDMMKFRPVRRPPRSARLATAARVGAVVGVILCVLLILATWLGRGAVVSAIDDLGTTVDSAIGRAQAATGQVSNRLNAAAASAGEVVTAANLLAANPPPAPEPTAGLAVKVGELADAYRGVRSRYADLRENVTTAVTALQQVTRFVPSLQAPEGAGDRIQAIDAKLVSIDDTLTGIFPALETGGPSGTIASAVAERATGVQSGLTDVSASVAELGASIDDLDAKAASTVSSLRTIVTAGTIAVTLFLVWILVLNVALWRLGEIWQRDAARIAGETRPVADPSGS